MYDQLSEVEVHRNRRMPKRSLLDSRRGLKAKRVSWATEFDIKLNKRKH